QILSNDACYGVVWSAGSERHDPMYRPCRIGLRPYDARDGRQRGSNTCQTQKLTAEKFHCAPLRKLRAARQAGCRTDAARSIGVSKGKRTQRVSSRSIRLGARELHHHGPLLRFIADEGAEVGGLSGQHHAPKLGYPRLPPGIGRAGIDLLVELVDGFGWGVLRRADAIPGACLVTRHDIANAWQLRQRLR